MRPIVLIILDGWGIGNQEEGNAVYKADLPTFNFIEKNFPSLLLQASGIGVGLMWGESGNSETGHLNIGAGRVVYQTLPRIQQEILNGNFQKNQIFLDAIENVKKNNSTLHLIGLVSSGAVHAYIDHLYALLELAKNHNIKNLILHVITDGRDSLPKEAAKFLEQLVLRLKDLKIGKIGSIHGRFYAMDRDKNWDRTKKTYDVLVNGTGEKIKNPIEYLKKQYANDLNDQMIEPAIIVDENENPIGLIKNNDSVIFYNFREDRARQLAEAFVYPDFKEFKRFFLDKLFFVAMTEYEKNLPCRVAFPPIKLINTLAEILSKNGKKQIHIAETEKYAHVTYFFNGGMEKTFEGEERILVPSLGARQYEKNPEMKTEEVAQKIIEAIWSGNYDFIVANFAAPDMVGHTGNFEATKKSLEIVDSSLLKILKEILIKNGILIITSDHGNVEEKIIPLTGQTQTEHTVNPVPFYLIANEFKNKSGMPLILRNKKTDGILADITPTVLKLMDLKIPEEITGNNLLQNIK